jgi:hypothetical protein
MNKLILGSLILLGAGAGPLSAAEARSLPPAVYGQLKKGAKLDKVWISPKFDGGKGFVVGKVNRDDALLDNPDANIIDYVPNAFSRYTIPESSNVLNLTLVGLEVISKPTMGHYSVSAEVEGQMLDKDGQLVLAFRTQETVKNRENNKENSRGVLDMIAWRVSRELGKDYDHALLVKNEMANGAGASPSGLLPPPPPKDQPSLDIQGRLMRLEDLKKRGLITEEEYKQHRDEILKSL